MRSVPALLPFGAPGVSQGVLGPVFALAFLPPALGSGALRSRTGLSGPRLLGHSQGRVCPLAPWPLCASGLWVRALCVPSRPAWAWCSGHLQGRTLPLVYPGLRASGLWVRALCAPSRPFLLDIVTQLYALGVSRALSPAHTTAGVPLGFLPLGSGALRSPSRHFWASVPGALAWHWPALPIWQHFKLGMPLWPH